MIIHIKRMDLFAVLTLTNDAGRTFTTTLRRDILKTGPEVREMVRRFKRDKKVIDKKPSGGQRGIRGPNRRKNAVHKQVYGRCVREKNCVGIKLTKQGVLV